MDGSAPLKLAGGAPQATNLAFILDKDSNLFLDGNALSYADVARAVDEYKAKGKPLQALIAADQMTPHGAVVKLIDAVRQNGILDFAINIEKE